MASKNQVKKDALIAAYTELGSSLIKTSVAITDFVGTLKGITDPAELEAIANGGLPTFSLGAPAAPVEGKGKAKEQVVEYDENGKKKRKKREQKIKDPNAPKRPPSAYIEFQNAVRNQFRADDPDLTYTEVLKKIAAQWGTMSDEEKQKWHTITSDKAAVYEEAKAAYAASKPEGDITMDIPVEAAAGKTIGKDGKEYSGKKRGRKSAADKQREAEEKAVTDGAFLQLVAQNVVAEGAAAAPVSEKKKKKEKNAEGSAAKVKTPKAAPAPILVAPAESSGEDSDDDEDSSEEDSDSDSSSDDEPSPAPEPVAAPKSNGKSAKRAAEDASGKKKKTKSA